MKADKANVAAAQLAPVTPIKFNQAAKTEQKRATMVKARAGLLAKAEELKNDP